MNIYISISEGINRLPGVVVDRLDNIVNLDHGIIMHDKLGSNELIKNYIDSSNCYNFMLYCFDFEVDYDADYPVIGVEDFLDEPDSVTNRLVNDADYGFVIWSLSDNEVLLIISQLLMNDKSAVVYAVHAQKFYTIESFPDLVNMIVDSTKYSGMW